MKEKLIKLEKKGAIERLKLDIAGQIRDGILLPDAPILPAVELSKLYKISYPTVHRLLTELAGEGLIYRVQGRGTFVSSQGKLRGAANEGAGVFMRSEGDLFGAMFSHVSNNLQAAGLFCMASDVLTQTFSKNPAACMGDVLKSNPAAFIVEGLVQFPFASLKKLEPSIRHLVFIHLLETEQPFNADAILSDCERGGYLAARHLLELGHRRLAIEVFGSMESSDLASLNQRAKLHGCLLACREFGIRDDQVRVFARLMTAEDEKPLRAMLIAPAPPTAVIAASDYQASRILTVINGLGLRVPNDISLIGYFNTSWCSRLDVALTSMSVREDVIAKRAVDCVCEKLLDPVAPKVRLLLEPEVIVRESTAPVCKRHRRPEA